MGAIAKKCFEVSGEAEERWCDSGRTLFFGDYAKASEEYCQGGSHAFLVHEEVIYPGSAHA